MKKLYVIQVLVFTLLFSTQSFAQTYKLIPASSDPASPADIFPVIMGDTSSTGERNDNNTIYQLENGQVYITSGRIVNKPDWTLQIEASDLANTDMKPILTRIPNASGTFPDMMRPEGNVTLRNLWVIMGETGPLDQHDWGKIRYMGDNTRIIADHCIMEKDRGGFFQIRGNNIKLYITNCILRNGGNRRVIQGNGRGVDARDKSLDTLVMKNTIVHNIQDRFFRSQGAAAPHKYIEIDHCTSFNNVGRHGFIQLGRVETAKITNNFFMNPIMLGSSPAYTDEQTQPDGDLHKVITLDTLYDNTSLTISNNNIFWTQDVMDYWASNDSVSAPGILSDLVMDNLGAAASDAYFQENVALNSVPATILQYVKDLYADPTALDMYDFIVEDTRVAGFPNDSGNLFDFTSFDPCYPSSAQSATAGTNGGAIGAVSFCSDLSNVFDVKIDQTTNLKVFPNPVTAELNFSFELQKSGQVNASLTDMRGKVVSQIFQDNLSVGTHNFTQNISGQLSKGIYFLSLQTERGITTKKIAIL